MNQRQIDVLDLLLDDHYALWDFADSFPQFRPDAAASLIDDLVELVSRGYVTVTFGRWHENETRPVALMDAETALRDPTVWQPTGQRPGHILELSAEGRNLLSDRGVWTL